MPQNVKLYAAIVRRRESFANPLLQEAHNTILSSMTARRRSSSNGSVISTLRGHQIQEP